MNQLPKNVTVPIAAIVLFAVMAAAPPARGGAPDVPPAWMGAYIVVLKDPALVPAGETPVPFEDGEIGRLGGRLVASHANMREVLLPLAEAKRLREHPAVAYVQRMWMGEPLDRWVDDEAPHTARRRIRTLQENDLTWTTGTYRYDGSGNIRQIGADTYAYDSAGRLSRAVVNGVTETYGYDSFGNLLEKNLAGRSASVPVDPMSNRVTGESYDAAGNLLTREGQPSFVYDSMGMVVTSIVQRPNAPATTRRHLYDADDERLGTVIDANLVRWTIRDFGGRVLREYESNNDRQFSPWWWTEDYVYAEGKLVAGAREPFYGGERHFHLDHLGSVRLVTHENDLAASRHDYYPFGTEHTSVVQEYVNLGLFPNPEPMKFTGHERDYRGYLNVDNTDYLDYMHARYYDPKMGRFLSVDPILGTSNRPQSWNRYSYVENNPLGAIDPTGMKMECVTNDDGSEECTVIPDDPEPEPFPQPDPLPDWVINVQAALTFGRNAADIKRSHADSYWRNLWNPEPPQFKNGTVLWGGGGAAQALLGTSRTNLLQNITNPRLRNLVSQLFRANARVGSGSTADAIRFEAQTGIMLSRAGHFQKGLEMRTALVRVLRQESLTAAERQAVRSILIDLQKALSGL